MSETTEGTELRTFEMLKATDKSQIGKTYDISYAVYLQDYPTVRIERSFTVAYVVSNFCDAGLTAFDYKVPAQCEQSRAAIEPKWMKDLYNPVAYQGQDKDLTYAMGKPVNFYGEPMDVSVDAGDLEGILEFSSLTNTLQIITDDLMNVPLGNHLVTITGSYSEINGKITTITKSIYIFISAEPTDENSQISDEVDGSIGEYYEGKILTRAELEEQVENTYVVTKQDTEVPYSPGAPIPYIVSFSRTGVLTIGWTTRMAQIEEPETLP